MNSTNLSLSSLIVRLNAQSMKPFAALQLCEHLCETLGSRLRLFRRVKTIVNRVEIPAVKGQEERLRFRRRLQRVKEILRDCHRRRTGGGLVPTAVPLRGFHLRQAGRSHTAFRDQRRGVSAVLSRPVGLRFSGREPLQERIGVERLFLPIDPPKADRLYNAIVPSDRSPSRARLEYPHP